MVTIWFIFEFINYKFVIFARPDLSANTPKAETDNGGGWEADVFHLSKINIESSHSACFCSELFVQSLCKNFSEI